MTTTTGTAWLACSAAFLVACGGCFPSDGPRRYLLTDAQIAQITDGTGMVTQDACRQLCELLYGSGNGSVYDGARADAGSFPPHTQYVSCGLDGRELTCSWHGICYGG